MTMNFFMGSMYGLRSSSILWFLILFLRKTLLPYRSKETLVMKITKAVNKIEKKETINIKTLKNNSYLVF